MFDGVDSDVEVSTAVSFLIESGQTLVCLGDSITQAEPGYVSLMSALIAAKYPDRGIQIVNAGIGGHKAPDMRARLERDVLAHRPQWVTISVGINDVWHGMDGGTGGGWKSTSRAWKIWRGGRRRRARRSCW